jgi:hypothetical protein
MKVLKETKIAFAKGDLDNDMASAAYKVLFLMNEGVIRCQSDNEVWVARGVLKLMGSSKTSTKRVAYMLAPCIFQ